MNLTIKQNNQVTEQVTSDVIDKLYNLTKEDVVNGIAAIATVLSGGLKGRIEAPAAYEDAVTYLNTKFGPNLIVSALAYYIRFADHNVLSVLLNAGIGDGNGISTSAAESASLGTIFQNNTQIETFDELPYFTSPNYGIGAFQNCTNLRRVDVSNSGFPNFIFTNCINLEYFHGPNSVQGELRIKDGVTTINDRALQHTKVRSVIFPDSLRTIKNSFFECSSLQSVTFGTGPLYIELNAFYQCTNLQEVHVPSLADWEDITFALDNYTANPLSYAHHLYVNGQEVTSITYPSGTTILKAMTFTGGSSITSVTIPSTVTSIEKNHFADCSNLVIQDLNLPNLTTLDAYAFQGTKVQTISNLGSVTSIPEYCFKGCSQLTTIYQGVLDNITVLNKEAFNNCTNLDSAKQSDNTISRVLRLPNLTYIALDAVRYTKFTEIADLGSITTVTGFSEMTNLTSVVLPQTCTAIGQSAFTNGNALTTINLNNITSIGANAFNLCENLMYFHGAGSVAGELNLSNVTSIGRLAFQTCKKLTSLTIGNSATSIGDGAFNNCSGLTSVTINAVTPPTLGSGAFNNTNNCPIYVPVGSVSAYQSASNWSTYASRIQAIQT